MGLSVIGLEGRVNYVITTPIRVKLSQNCKQKCNLEVPIFNWRLLFLHLAAIQEATGLPWCLYQELRGNFVCTLTSLEEVTLGVWIRRQWRQWHRLFVWNTVVTILLLSQVCIPQRISNASLPTFFFPVISSLFLSWCCFVVVFYSSSSSSLVLLVLDLFLSFFVAFRPSCFLFCWHLLCETLFLVLFLFCFVFVFVFCTKFFRTSFFF